MSVEATVWAWEQSLSGSKKLVLLCLADWAGCEHASWYGVDRLAERVGVSRRQVQTLLGELEADGLILREERRRGNGSQSTNLIRVGCSPLHPGGEADCTGGVKSAAPPEPSVEPSEEEVSDDTCKKATVADLHEVWMHYVAVMSPRQIEAGPQELGLIRDALKVATVNECKRAIDGCKASAFHMGQNDRGKKYNRLSHILKGKRGVRTTREQIDLFLDVLGDGATDAPKPNRAADPTRLAGFRNTVRMWAAGQVTSDVGEDAVAKLDAYGIHTSLDWVNGKVTFTEAA